MTSQPVHRVGQQLSEGLEQSPPPLLESHTRRGVSLNELWVPGRSRRSGGCSWKGRREGRAWSSWTAGAEPVFSRKGLRKACVGPGSCGREQKLQTSRNSGELGAPATEQPEGAGGEDHFPPFIFWADLFYTQEARLHPLEGEDPHHRGGVVLTAFIKR